MTGFEDQIRSAEVLKAGLVDLDATWFIQIAVFLTLYVILRYAFFKPYIAVLKRRDESTRGLRARAVAIAEEARRLEASLATRLTEARAEAVLARRRLADEGARLRDEILGRERARVQAELAREMEALAAQRRELDKRADAVASELAAMIESQVRQPEGVAR